MREKPALNRENDPIDQTDQTDQTFRTLRGVGVFSSSSFPSPVSPETPETPTVSVVSLILSIFLTYLSKKKVSGQPFFSLKRSFYGYAVSKAEFSQESLESIVGNAL